MTAGFWATVDRHVLLHLILHSTGLAVLLSHPLHPFPFVSAYLLLFSLPEPARRLLIGEHVIPGLSVSVGLRAQAQLSKEDHLAGLRFMSGC